MEDPFAKVAKQMNIRVPDWVYRCSKMFAVSLGISGSAYVDQAMRERMWRDAMPSSEEELSDVIAGVFDRMRRRRNP